MKLKLLKKYSTLANVLAAVSAAGFAVLMLFTEYLTFWPLIVISIGLAIMGITGKVVKEEIEDLEDDIKDNNNA